MRIRPFVDADLPALIDLTIETFRPHFENDVRPSYGEELFELHHGRWEQDYRDWLPSLHDPASRRWVAVADTGGGVAGFVAWNAAGDRRDHGLISLLAVAEPYRRSQVATELCRHALDAMKADGVEVVELNTGGEDAFHAPARALYESLGFLRVPIAGYIQKL
jgi:ribosomal protein S18 acetylase RimI-like enzyme